MDRATCLKLARESGFDIEWIGNTPRIELLEKFAALVAAAEREACAKIADAAASYWASTGQYENGFHTASDIAVNIRARGEAGPS